jgi:hypothetical protein
VRYKAGEEQSDVRGGHTQYTYDSHNFYSTFGHDYKKLQEQRVDVYDVRIATQVTDLFSDKPVPVFFVMSLIWEPVSARWLPWEAGFNDASGQSGPLPVPRL